MATQPGAMPLPRRWSPGVLAPGATGGRHRSSSAFYQLHAAHVRHGGHRRALASDATYSVSRRRLRPAARSSTCCSSRCGGSVTRAAPCARPGRAGARVIEIGSGDGRLIRLLAEHDCSVVGVEPYAAQGDTGWRSWIRPVEALGVEPECRRRRPLARARASRRPAGRRRGRQALRRHGRIVVSVPNLDSLQARIGGRRWFHLDVPRHAVHFTRRGLVRLLERCGLRPRARARTSSSTRTCSV